MPQKLRARPKPRRKLRVNPWEKVILIVDNRPDQGMEKLERVLSTEEDENDRRKYTVHTYSDPAEFMEALQSRQGIFYDLALVDFHFGENEHFEGADLIDTMKQKYPSRPVLCCSAYTDEQYIWDGFSNHTRPNGVFTKTMCETDPGRALDVVENTIKYNPVKRD